MSEINDLIKLPVKYHSLQMLIADSDDYIFIDCREFENPKLAEFIADAINNHERLEQENAELIKVIKHGLSLIKLSEAFDINSGKGWKEFKSLAEKAGITY